MRASIFTLLLLFGLVSGAFAQATLRVGDPVQLTISGVPQDEQSQLNNVYIIDVNGLINLPYINKVKAQGRTPAELAAAVEQAYRANRIYTNPTITVLMQPSARFVNVGGAVRNPTRVPFTEDMTLLTAINAAGGFNDFADQGHVRLLRGSNVQVVNVKRIRSDPAKDIALQPGDKVEVPQSLF